MIDEFYKEHRSKGKIITMKHCEAMGVSRRTVHSMIRRVDNDKIFKKSTGTGRIANKGRRIKLLVECVLGTIGQLY